LKYPDSKFCYKFIFALHGKRLACNRKRYTGLFYSVIQGWRSSLARWTIRFS